jgi:ATP-binding cassette subfamily B protein
VETKTRKLMIGPVLRVFGNHSRRYPKAAVFLTLAIILQNFVHIITPWYFKKFFDAIASPLPVAEVTETLFAILLILLGLRVSVWVLRRIRGFTSVYFESHVMTDLMRTSFSYLLRHSWRFFTDNFAGSLTRKVNRLARAFEDIVDQVEFNLIPLVVTVTGILFVLFRRHIYLGVVLSIGVVVFLIFHLVIARWKQRYDIEKAKKDSEATGVLADALTNSSTIKLFTGYKQERSLYDKITEELRRIRALTWNLNESIEAMQGLLMLGIEFSMLYFTIILWQRGFLTIGDFVLVQIYLISLFDRLWDFGRVLRRIFEGFADAAEMVELLDLPHEIKDAPGAKPLVISNGEVEFRQVEFSFHQTRKILDNFNLTIRPGEKVALVGPSGAGKTTITKILLRLYDLSGGKILIDNQSIAEVTQDSLHNKISLVPQEPILFHRTLKENILYGRQDAKEEEVIEAAKKARCHEFISTLPYGYDTLVGERGVKLSGGERQRVAIARAILKDAPILVLDEATSSLDSESEALIQEALRELMRGRTTIAIAHRLSTIMQMDRIVVIDEGRVVATGTHQELLGTQGIYKKLWEIQAGGFTPLLP